MVGYVYIIEGIRGSKVIRYVGSTTVDVTTRFAQHEAGIGSKTTRSMKNKRVVFSLKCNGTTNCRRVEYYLKHHRKVILHFLNLGIFHQEYNNFLDWCSTAKITIKPMI